MHAMHMRAVEHTIRRGFCTHHAAWVNHTENRCSRRLLHRRSTRRCLCCPGRTSPRSSRCAGRLPKPCHRPRRSNLAACLTQPALRPRNELLRLIYTHDAENLLRKWKRALAGRVPRLHSVHAQEFATRPGPPAEPSLSMARGKLCLSISISSLACALCRWRLTVHFTALVGALIHFQRVPPDLRQSLLAEVLVVHQFQLLFLFLFFTPPADPNIAHTRRVVLELVGARLVRIELLGHQNVLVAVNGNTGLLIRLVDPGAISKLDRRRRVPLGVAGNVPPRLC